MAGDKDGMLAWSQGEFQYIPPEGNGRFPILVPGQDMAVLWNEERYDQPFIYNGVGKLSLLLNEAEPQRLMDVQISPDQMTVDLRVSYQPGLRIHVEEAAVPESRLVLRTRREELGTVPFTENEAQRFLQDHGVVFGLNKERLRQVLQAANGEWMWVARGQEPLHGEDGRITPLFSAEKRHLVLQEGTVIQEIAAVSAGAMIAVLEAPTLGKPGQTVTGQMAPARPGKTVSLVAGKGATLTEDGKKAFAAISGRPVLSRNHIEVLQVEEIRGDVQFRDGGIRFLGDVWVYGNVLDGADIKAGGEIRVFGRVTQAVLRAKTGIHVQKVVFGGKLFAGVPTEVIKQCRSLLELINQELGRLEKSLHQVLQSLSPNLQHSDQIGKVLQMLVDRKHPQLSKYVQALQTLFQRHSEEFKPEQQNLLNELVQKFSRPGPSTLTSNDITVYCDKIAEQLKRMEEESAAQVAHVHLNTVDDSELEVNGDVKIDKSTMYSRVKCRGEFHCHGKVRSSSIEAEMGFFAKEVGTASETRVVIQVGEKGTVQADLLYPGTVVGIGKLQKTTLRKATQVKWGLEQLEELD